MILIQLGIAIGVAIIAILIDKMFRTYSHPHWLFGQGISFVFSGVVVSLSLSIARHFSPNARALHKAISFMFPLGAGVALFGLFLVIKGGLKLLYSEPPSSSQVNRHPNS